MRSFKKYMYKTYNIPTIACNEEAFSGGVGVSDFTVLLDKPLGGIIIIDFQANAVADKLEIIHNGVKKATSGMTVANSGPFDNVYGDPTIPTETQANTVDQFIGTVKGTIPTRAATFISETGITDVVQTRQQLIWWVYTESDYNSVNTVVVRAVGSSPSTGWDLQRLCTNQNPIGI